MLKLSTAEGVKGLLVHLNVQPSVLDGTGAAAARCVSGDLAGVGCAALEAAGCRVERYPLDADNGFLLDDSFLSYLEGG